MILSLLDTSDLCSVSCVNKFWRNLTSDQILWRELLIRDMCKWDSMSNKSHPLLPEVWNYELLNSETAMDFSTLLYEQSNTTLFDGQSTIQDRDVNHSSPNYKNMHAANGINFKALYIHSSFQRKHDDNPTDMYPVNTNGIPGFIKSFLTSGPENRGEIIITGPGMDSTNTSKIFRALMWECKFVETNGLLPGNRDMIGSGVHVTYKEKSSFKLIALYSSSERLRGRVTGIERLRNSSMFQEIQNEARSDDETENASTNDIHFSVSDALQFYFASKAREYKIIYVVDATSTQTWDEVSCGKLELEALLNGTIPSQGINQVLNQPEQNETNDGKAATPFKRPLLVLSCVANPETPRFSCVQITAMLDLPRIVDRQWRVQDVTVSTIEGIEKGFDWVLHQP